MKWAATSPESWRREDGRFDVAQYVVDGQPVFLLWEGERVVGRFETRAAAIAATKRKASK